MRMLKARLDRNVHKLVERSQLSEDAGDTAKLLTLMNNFCIKTL